MSKTIQSRVKFLDPMRRDYRGRENQPGIDREIVHGDLGDIEQSNIVLANCPTPSWGTGMEILYSSKILRTVVYTVCPSDRPSPWLTYWSTKVLRELDEAIKEIVQFIRENDEPKKRWSIYLAGAINKCSDEVCNEWRTKAKQEILEGLNQ